MNKKITKRDNINALLGIVKSIEDFDLKFIEKFPAVEGFGKENIVAYLEHELELLDKKNGSEKKPTKDQEANEGIKALIREVLEGSEPVTISTMQKDGRLADFSNQKLSSLIRQMVNSGEIVRSEVKKVAYFALSE